jgi:hypothetical protein
MTDTSAGTSTSRELAIAPGATVDISLASGSLVVRGTDDDRVVVRTLGGEPLGGNIQVDAEPNLVRIREGETGWKVGPFGGSTRHSRDIAVDLPRTVIVRVRTLSGDVVATGIGADSRWTTASGDLRLEVAGGNVQLETMSGDGTLDATGPLTLAARTASGDLRIRAPRLDGLAASSTSGDVRVEADLAAGADHVISSVSGDVELATRSPVRVDVQTLTGEVVAVGRHHAEGGRGHRTLVVGDGSVAVSTSTTSGDVRLRALGGSPGAAPEPPARPAAPTPPVAPEPPVAPVAPEPPVRPVDAEEDTQAWNAAGPIVDKREADRLEILRALERGELDIESAARRLETLEQAGPRYFRGWC